MENLWKTLGISKTKDQVEIKKAYHVKLRETNPEEKPEEFMVLREAYEAAIQYAKSANSSDSNLVSSNNEDNKEIIKDEERIAKLVKRIFIHLQLFGESSSIKRFKQIIKAEYFNHILRQRIIEYYIKVYLLQFRHYRDLPKKLIMMFILIIHIP